MKNYESPMMFENEELAEGVYLASGDAVGDGTGGEVDGGAGEAGGSGGAYCQSIYMKGRYVATACQTCGNAQKGQNKCQQKTPHNGKQNMPTWEKQGWDPAANGCPQAYIDEVHGVM